MNLTHHLVPLINIRNKKMKSWTHLPSPRNTKDVFSARSKHDFLFQPTTTHLPIKALQTTKITKLGLPFLFTVVFNRKSTISELKRKFIFSPLKKWSPIARLELLNANHYTTDIYTMRLTYNIIYLNQTNVVKPCWYFTSLKIWNIIWSLNSIPIP